MQIGMTYIGAGLRFAGIVVAHLLAKIVVAADLGAPSWAVCGDVETALGEAVIAGTASGGNLRGKINIRNEASALATSGLGAIVSTHRRARKGVPAVLLRFIAAELRRGAVSRNPVGKVSVALLLALLTWAPAVCDRRTGFGHVVGTEARFLLQHT